MSSAGGDGDAEVFRESYRTGNVEEAEQFLCAAYTDVTITASTGGPPFAYRHDTVETDRVAVSRQTTTTGYALVGRPIPSVTVASGTRPGVVALAGRRYDHLGLGVDGSAALAPLGCDYDAYVSAGSDLDLISLDLAAVGRYATAVTGVAPGGLAFTGLVPVTAASDRHWRATVAHVRDDLLAGPQTARSPIVQDLAFRALAAAALSTFPNTALATTLDPERFRPGPRGLVGPARLREVLEHLEAHAEDPVGPETVAELAGAPFPAVVAGLRRLGYEHPARHLWRSRLRGVHATLRAADPHGPDTLEDVATRWGFTRLERLRVAHVAVFGEPPERTWWS